MHNNIPSSLPPLPDKPTQTPEFHRAADAGSRDIRYAQLPATPVRNIHTAYVPPYGSGGMVCQMALRVVVTYIRRPSVTHRRVRIMYCMCLGDMTILSIVHRRGTKYVCSSADEWSAGSSQHAAPTRAPYCCHSFVARPKQSTVFKSSIYIYICV